MYHVRHEYSIIMFNKLKKSKIARRQNEQTRKLGEQLPLFVSTVHAKRGLAPETEAWKWKTNVGFPTTFFLMQCHVILWISFYCEEYEHWVNILHITGGRV